MAAYLGCRAGLSRRRLGFHSRKREVLEMVRALAPSIDRLTSPRPRGQVGHLVAVLTFGAAILMVEL